MSGAMAWTADGAVVLSREQCSSLAGLVAGATAKEAAKARWVTVDTEKTHRRRLYEKLGVHNGPTAVARAFCLGLLTPDGRTPPRLTEREVQVVAAVARSDGRRSAGDVLGLSPLTVKTHLARITHRTGSATAAHCVGVVFHSRLLPASWPEVLEISERPFSRGR